MNNINNSNFKLSQNDSSLKTLENISPKKDNIASNISKLKLEKPEQKLTDVQCLNLFEKLIRGETSGLFSEPNNNNNTTSVPPENKDYDAIAKNLNSENPISADTVLEYLSHLDNLVYVTESLKPTKTDPDDSFFVVQSQIVGNLCDEKDVYLPLIIENPLNNTFFSLISDTSNKTVVLKFNAKQKAIFYYSPDGTRLENELGKIHGLHMTLQEFVEKLKGEEELTNHDLMTEKSNEIYNKEPFSLKDYVVISNTRADAKPIQSGVAVCRYMINQLTNNSFEKVSLENFRKEMNIGCGIDLSKLKTKDAIQGFLKNHPGETTIYSFDQFLKTMDEPDSDTLKNQIALDINRATYTVDGKKITSLEQLQKEIDPRFLPFCHQGVNAENESRIANSLKTAESGFYLTSNKEKFRNTSADKQPIKYSIDTKKQTFTATVISELQDTMNDCEPYAEIVATVHVDLRSNQAYEKWIVTLIY